MDKQRQEEIIRVLQAKGVDKPCPRCGNEKFELIGESGLQLQENPNPLMWEIMGPVVPVILISCSRCGFLTQHAQGPLGLARQSK
jgi:ribosomal protein S27AE